VSRRRVDDVGDLFERQPDGDLEAKRRLGEPLRVLDLALSFSGLFARAKRKSG